MAATAAIFISEVTMTICPKYAISWITFFDNALYIDFCYAPTDNAALREAFLRLTSTEYNSEFDPDIYQAAFDCDGMIQAKRVE